MHPSPMNHVAISESSRYPVARASTCAPASWPTPSRSAGSDLPYEHEEDEEEDESAR